MCLRALPHRDQKNIMRRASLKYLDAWLGSVMSVDAEQLVILCYFLVLELVCLIELELQMIFRALRHSNGRRIVMRAI
eukprot:7126233-Pyramimonas_sp.AAC.1